MRYSRVIALSAMAMAMIGFNLKQESISAAECPCDIYAAGGTPCVAAHSTVRALYGSYSGPLYQVTRKSDKATMDIGVVSPGGLANSAAQDSFLKSSNGGSITIIYDQSGNGNKLTPAPAGGWPPAETAAAATAAKIKINGRTAYGIYTTAGNFPGATQFPGVGYRNDSTKGIVTGNGAEGMYMVCSGKHYNQYCCFDYGNAQTNNKDNGNATMECIFFGNSTQWGKGSGTGPWVLNDCENGLQAGVDSVAGSKSWAGNTTITADYVTGIVKSKNTNFYAIRGGDAKSGTVKTMYAGRQYPGWYPKKLEGAIVLGIGGDNSHTGVGTFFEGAMTSGYPSDTTDSLVELNIAAAKYGDSIATPTKQRGAVKPDNPHLFTADYNAAQGKATISYMLRDARNVRMNIVNLKGRQVATIADGVMPPGRHAAVWHAERVPVGVYMCRVAIDGLENWTGKIVIRK